MEVKEILFSTTNPNREQALLNMGFKFDGLYYRAEINGIPFKMGYTQMSGLTSEGWAAYMEDVADAIITADTAPVATTHFTPDELIRKFLSWCKNNNCEPKASSVTEFIKTLT